MRPATVIALGLLAACGGSDSGVGAGEACFRTAQCADGLACVAGRCSSDVTGIGEAGVPGFDAGPMLMGRDAGPRVDGGPLPDSGPPPMLDSGPPGMDSGPPPVDSGPPPMMDSGPPMTDSGPPDAGTAADGG